MVPRRRSFVTPPRNDTDQEQARPSCRRGDDGEGWTAALSSTVSSPDSVPLLSFLLGWSFRTRVYVQPTPRWWMPMSTNARVLLSRQIMSSSVLYYAVLANQRAGTMVALSSTVNICENVALAQWAVGSENMSKDRRHVSWPGRL